MHQKQVVPEVRPTGLHVGRHQLLVEERATAQVAQGVGERHGGQQRGQQAEEARQEVAYKVGGGVASWLLATAAAGAAAAFGSSVDDENAADDSKIEQNRLEIETNKTVPTLFLPDHEEDGHRVVGAEEVRGDQPVGVPVLEEGPRKVGHWGDLHEEGDLRHRDAVRHDDPENGEHAQAVEEVKADRPASPLGGGHNVRDATSAGVVVVVVIVTLF